MHSITQVLYIYASPGLRLTLVLSPMVCFVLQKGDTALHLVCRQQKLGIAKLLLEKMSREAALGLNEVNSGGCKMYICCGCFIVLPHVTTLSIHLFFESVCNNLSVISFSSKICMQPV